MSKIYFASDFHLGIDAHKSSKEREKQIISWMDKISDDAEALYLVGDLFDFWFEYSSVVPKGYIRLLGRLAQWVDSGLELFVFTGNHDMWMAEYLENELGIKIIRNPISKIIKGKNFFIGHGDGLGPGDNGYKFIKGVFASPVSQWLYARLHPNFAFKLAQFWSGKSREKAHQKDQWLGKDREWLVQFAQEEIKNKNIDYFVFGHRHLPIHCTLENDESKYINLGDWLQYNSYAWFDGELMRIDFYDREGLSPIVV